MFSKTVLFNVFLGFCGLSLLLGTVALTLGRLGERSPWQLITVGDSSMGKGLPHRSLAITKKSPSHVWAVGELVSFNQPGQKERPVVHRIERIINDNDEHLIITKADELAGVDTWLLTDKSITGIYKGHLRLAGSWLEFLRQPSGTVALVIVPGLLIIFAELTRVYRHLSEVRLNKPSLSPSSA